jgi:hypothetical protein
MQPAQINDAIVSCLEHVASSTSPPAIAAADFLIRLLDDRVFPLNAVDEVTIRVGIILRGITERDMLNKNDLPEGWSCLK